MTEAEARALEYLDRNPLGVCVCVDEDCPCLGECVEPATSHIAGNYCNRCCRYHHSLIQKSFLASDHGEVACE